MSNEICFSFEKKRQYNSGGFKYSENPRNKRIAHTEETEDISAFDGQRGKTVKRGRS